MQILFAVLVLLAPGQAPTPDVMQGLARVCWELNPAAGLNVKELTGTNSLLARCFVDAGTQPAPESAPEAKTKRPPARPDAPAERREPETKPKRDTA